MRSRSSSPMEFDEPRFDHIRQTFHINYLTEVEKDQTITKDRTQTKMSLFALKMIWSAKIQRMRSMRTKANKKSNKLEAEGNHRKTKKLLWCSNIKAEVIRNDIPRLISRTIYNYYKLLNEKNDQFKKKSKLKNL